MQNIFAKQKIEHLNDRSLMAQKAFFISFTAYIFYKNHFKHLYLPMILIILTKEGTYHV